MAAKHNEIRGVVVLFCLSPANSQWPPTGYVLTEARTFRHAPRAVRANAYVRANTGSLSQSNTKLDAMRHLKEGVHV